MAFLLSSFKVVDKGDVPVHTGGYPSPIEMRTPDAAFSIAVYQPAWLPQLPVIPFFDIRDDAGWIRPRLFVGQSDPLFRYGRRLLDLYHSRADEFVDWLVATGYGMTEDVALCCWCPYDKAAKRQIEEHGTFVCHSAVVEVFLEDYGLEVIRDVDRQKMVQLELAL